MKIYKDVPREYIDHVLESVRCDICHVVYNTRWNRYLSRFDVLETVVKIREGSAYPEAGSGTEHIIDICPDCFKNKLIPFVESFGSRIEETDWDF